MRVSDVLYFAPNLRFKDLDIENNESLIKAFEHRVNGFYLDPAEELNKEHKAFAVGVLCVTAIDFLAKYIIGPIGSKKRFIKWISDNIKGEERSESAIENLSEKIYDDFRCGLVHEGRIKNGSEFSYELQEEMIFNDGKALAINPNLLLEAIRNSFNRYIEVIKKQSEAFHLFKGYLKEDFRIEFEQTGI